MTLIVTYAEEMLACFTREPDGSMRQRAAIHTGPQVPTPAELAEMGSGLALRYAWGLNGYNPIKASPAAKKALLPVAKRAPRVQQKRRQRNASREEIQARIDHILRYLEIHPSGTLREIVTAALGPKTTEHNISNWRFQFDKLTREGKLERVIGPYDPAAHNRPYIFSLKGAHA